MKALRVLMVFVLLSCAGAGLHAQPVAPVAAQQNAKISPAQIDEQAEYDENAQYKHSAMVAKFGKLMGMSTNRAADVFEFFNFAILALAVGGFAVKALPKMFRDRDSAIQKDLVDARTATEEASSRMNTIEDRLSALDGQIAAMRTQAEKDAALDEQRIKASVAEETKRILAAADQEIAAASLNAQRQLQQYAAELAIEQAARKLVINAETDRLLVQGFARRLVGDDTKGGQN